MSAERRPLRLGLRGMLIIMAVSLVASVVILISTYFIERHRVELERMSHGQSLALRGKLSDKGISLARTVAVTSERAIVVLDFLFLHEVIDTAVETDPEVVYGIVMDAERRALVHSDKQELNRILDDPASQHAAKQTAPSTQELERNGAPILEAIAPISVGGSHWGTIRLGLSLDGLNRELAESERRAEAQILESVVATILAALLLLVLGSVIGTFVAARVARPLRSLLEGVRRVERGELERATTEWLGASHWVSPASEFIHLGRAFTEMAQAVMERDEALRKRNRDLKCALEAAEEASRLKSEFVANVSHELRTPLNSIVNVPEDLVESFDRVGLWQCDACNAEYRSDVDEAEELCPDCRTPMRKKRKLLFVGDADEHKSALERIVHSGRHLLNVVNDLLDFSKLEAGKMSLVISEVAISQLVTEVSATMSGLADREGISLGFQQLDRDISLRADKLKLSQVLINLIGNAIKYTPRGGLVDVTVSSEPNGTVHFAVHDTGVGLPSDQLEQVFESFRQVDGGKTRKHGGTGLGLAISKRLVDLHRGRIWAESALGKGSTFHVTIPKDPH